MATSTIILLVVLGFVPSLSWLLFYLKKDPYPEPKYLVSKTFLLGIVMAPLAIAAQWGFREAVLHFQPGYLIQVSVWFFLWAAAIEEIVKFLVVKFVVLHDPEFDEPTDAMIYMISAALGFAAIENILVLFQAIPNGTNAALQIWLLRFAGATLLHAVASAMVGYFLALAWFYSHHCKKLITLGIALATLLHLIFNMIILSAGGKPEGLIYSTIFLIFIAVIISAFFTKFKNALQLAAKTSNPSR
ncbi:MAG: PrsW family intramembrane metalloprotease [Candidatus Yanofskybacteria bacterium]|nr:PrsW family intramembrane metalloprotease [Candidatus Yanofskybacteria bacterium]